MPRRPLLVLLTLNPRDHATGGLHACLSIRAPHLECRGVAAFSGDEDERLIAHGLTLAGASTNLNGRPPKGVWPTSLSRSTRVPITRLKCVAIPRDFLDVRLITEDP